MMQHFPHTFGANAVFVALAEAARARSQLGDNEALEEWRSAAACARGGFRPDGYGCYRRGASRYGFFLEYDRGTERAHEYAAKIAAYYPYRDSNAAARDYTGFPTTLVVSTRAEAEERFAQEAYLASERRGGEAIPFLFTTTGLIVADPEGLLGPIWRSPASASSVAARGSWPSVLPRPTAFRTNATSNRNPDSPRACFVQSDLSPRFQTGRRELP
jgi:hypothetical protein